MRGNSLKGRFRIDIWDFCHRKGCKALGQVESPSLKGSDKAGMWPLRTGLVVSMLVVLGSP